LRNVGDVMVKKVDLGRLSVRIGTGKRGFQHFDKFGVQRASLIMVCGIGCELRNNIGNSNRGHGCGKNICFAFELPRLILVI